MIENIEFTIKEEQVKIRIKSDNKDTKRYWIQITEGPEDMDLNISEKDLIQIQEITMMLLNS